VFQVSFINAGIPDAKELVTRVVILSLTILRFLAVFRQLLKRHFIGLNGDLPTVEVFIFKGLPKSLSLARRAGGPVLLLPPTVLIVVTKDRDVFSSASTLSSGDGRRISHCNAPPLRCMAKSDPEANTKICVPICVPNCSGCLEVRIY